MATAFDDIPVIHEACNGQGCRQCGQTGEVTVRVSYTEVTR